MESAQAYTDQINLSSDKNKFTNRFTDMTVLEPLVAKKTQLNGFKREERDNFKELDGKSWYDLGNKDSDPDKKVLYYSKSI